MKGDALDPKALIREAYRIEGIGAQECRSIFLDWALSLPAGMEAPQAALALIARYAQEAPDHPMTEVLRGAGQKINGPARRGGRAARVQDS